MGYQPTSLRKTHITSFTHPSFSQNTSRLDFESVRAQFLSENIGKKQCYLLNTIMIHLSYVFPCWIWHLALSWARFLSNKLEFFVSCNTKITRTSSSFFILSLCVLRCIFYKKINCFFYYFWQLYQIHTFNNNDEEMRTSHFNFELNYKTTFYDKKS